jgi:hypothetical protein
VLFILKTERKAVAGAAIGGLVLLITLVIFFYGNLNVEKQSIDIVALLLILFSEVVLFGSIAALNLLEGYRDRAFIKSGIISTLFLYWITVTVFSVLARENYVNNISGFVTVHFVVFGIALIISILIAVSYKTISENNEKVINAGVSIKKCEDTAKLLFTNTKYIKYKDMLNEIYEDIKYSDKTVEVAEDELIFNQLSVLSEKLNSNSIDDSEDIKDSIDITKQIVKQRDLSIRKLKRGEI